jgi:hypothetical protein
MILAGEAVGVVSGPERWNEASIWLCLDAPVLLETGNKAEEAKPSNKNIVLFKADPGLSISTPCPSN